MNKGNWSEAFRCLGNEKLSCCHSQEKMATHLPERGDFPEERFTDLDK